MLALSLACSTMDRLNFSDLKANLASTLDKVNNEHKPVLITHKGHKPTVLMSLEDFQAYQETVYLMASPKNAERLNEAISEVENTHESLNRSLSNKSITITSNS